DGIRDFHVTGVQTCALPISRLHGVRRCAAARCEWDLYHLPWRFAAAGDQERDPRRDSGGLDRHGRTYEQGVDDPAGEWRGFRRRSEERRGGKEGGEGGGRCG